MNKYTPQITTSQQLEKTFLKYRSFRAELLSYLVSNIVKHGSFKIDQTAIACKFGKSPKSRSGVSSIINDYERHGFLKSSHSYHRNCSYTLSDNLKNPATLRRILILLKPYGQITIDRLSSVRDKRLNSVRDKVETLYISKEDINNNISKYCLPCHTQEIKESAPLLKGDSGAADFFNKGALYETNRRISSVERDVVSFSTNRRISSVERDVVSFSKKNKKIAPVEISPFISKDQINGLDTREISPNGSLTLGPKIEGGRATACFLPIQVYLDHGKCDRYGEEYGSYDWSTWGEEMYKRMVV